MAILKADREAPMGWVYLIIYEDSSFEFISRGLRVVDEDVYNGKVVIHNDSMFFHYADGIPRAGKTAVFDDEVVAYIDGEYPERVNISMSKLRLAGGEKLQCPCCAYYTLEEEEHGQYDICPVCFWEDDALQSSKPDYAGGANDVSLNQARKNFLKFGACEERFVGFVRRVREDEMR